MYEREKSLLLPHSCGAAVGALALLRDGGDTWAAWPHHNQVALLKLSGDEAEPRTVPGRPADDGSSIMQVRWVSMGEWQYLVVACTGRVDFYNQQATMLLFSYPLVQEGGRTFARGIAAVADLCCVGTWDGSVLVFQSDSGRQGELRLGEKLRQHSSAIGALASGQGQLVSGDEQGSIVQWSSDAGGVAKLRRIDHYGSPVTGLALLDGLLVATYGSGHLRVFDLASGQIRAQATAHARWITALDVAVDSGLVLTAGEDARVKVWSLTDSSCPLTHKFTEREPDSRLVGAGFLRSDGASFGIAAYDQKNLFCYAM